MSESTLSSRITAVRKAVGDSGEQQALIRTIARKGIRFVGEVSERAPGSAPAASASAVQPSPAVAAPLRQEIHFCTASDGVRIAYAEVGQGPATGQDRQLAQSSRIRLGEPGLEPAAARDRGRTPTDPLRRARQRTVRLGRRRTSRSKPSCATLKPSSKPSASSDSRCSACRKDAPYRSPTRCVTRSASAGSSCTAVRARAAHARLAARDRAKRRHAHADARGLGEGKPAVPADLHLAFIPGGTAEQMQWFNDLQRNTASPENAMRDLRWRSTRSTSPICCRRCSVPTLVLALPRRCGAAVRRRAPPRSRYSGRALRRARGQQPRAAARASRPGAGWSRKCGIFFNPEAQETVSSCGEYGIIRVPG